MNTSYRYGYSTALCGNEIFLRSLPRHATGRFLTHGVVQRATKPEVFPRVLFVVEGLSSFGGPVGVSGPASSALAVSARCEIGLWQALAQAGHVAQR
jgi:hypothetical protein